MAAAKLGIDPAEMRFKNLIQPEQMPYTTATGGYYDAGNYPAAFKHCLETFEYDKMREYQKKAREEGRLVGIGLATVTDPTVTNIAYVAIGKSVEERKKERDKSGSGEACIVKVDPLGGVTVICSTNPQGQGHETVISQIVADEFGIHPDEVVVDTVVDSSDRLYSITTGSFSSRFASSGTTAVVKAARQCVEKGRKIAAHLLKIDIDDVVVDNGKFFPKGSPEKAIKLRHIAGAAHWNQYDLPEGCDVGLFGTSFYSLPTSRPPDEQDRVNSSNTYGFVAEAIGVEIIPETGEIKFLRWSSVHDCGTILNPQIVRGQVLGSIVQAIGGSMYEEQAYDENGQCLTASFADYLCPTAMEMPKVDVGHTETPCVLTPLGAKGTGEGSSMAAPPAIGNAIADALAPLGIVIDELPMTPSKVWHLIQDAKAKKN
jgi:2-furoyl-CoA dehydrogenase large subunit